MSDRLDFFREEFTTDYKIATMKSVQIANWDGIVMGGGLPDRVGGGELEEARACQGDRGIRAQVLAIPGIGIGRHSVDRVPGGEAGIATSGVLVLIDE